MSKTDEPLVKIPSLLTGDAWRNWCRRLEATGLEILGDAYPDTERDRAEGFRAITRKIVYATQFEIEAGDPEFPTFVRLQDPYNQWGGPNPDNVYLRANIDAHSTYRVWGDITGTRQVIFSLHEGDMQLGEFGVYGECSLDQLTVKEGELELFVSPTPHDGNWIESHPKARILTIRVYQSDWGRDAVPPFYIVKVGNEGRARPPLDALSMEKALDRAAKWIERSTSFWNSYTAEAWKRSTPNEIAAAAGAAGGADNIAYGSCCWELGPDEALIITSEVPDADYWGFSIHTLAWLESGDFADRQTSVNHKQAYVDDDGLVRLVLSGQDPCVPNWIDTEGRHRGMLVYRWVWAKTTPVPSAEFVSVGDVREKLPASHPLVEPAERRVELADRREQVWRRYI